MMPLPLPKVLYDVGPGGGIVTSMGGGNALANANHLRKYNQAKAEYAPESLLAQAASQAAYANNVGPQYIAKILQDAGFKGNTSDPVLKSLVERVQNAGMNNNPLVNTLNQRLLQRYGNQGQKPQNPISWMMDQFKNIVHPGGQQRNAVTQIPGQQQSGNVFNQPTPTPQINPGIGSPVDENGNQVNENGESITPVTPDQAQSLERLNQEGRKPTKPIEMTLDTGRRNPSKSYMENEAYYKSVQKEGEKTGEIRAKDREELDNQYEQALQSEAPLKHLNKIVSNPTFQNMRKFPWFQSLQLGIKSKDGTYEEQKLVGDFQTTALRAVAETIKSFGGRILDKEVTLANDMKISPNDTIPVMIGKLPSIEAFNIMTMKRARIANKLMRDYHISKGDALEQADKYVDGEKIRSKVERELEGYPSRDDIEFTAKELNITPEEVINRLKAKGKYHA